MSDHSANFRSALFGGFHRQDVLAYIESKTKTHTEELNELGRRLDASQKELSDLREALNRANNSLEELRSADAARDASYRTQSDELSQLRTAHEALRASSREREEELSALRVERDQLIREMSEIQTQLNDYEQAKIRVANIELEAYARAKKIEDTAISNAEMARSALTTLVCEAKRRFDQTRDDATRTICYISEELDRLRNGMRNLPGFFEIISGEIEQLKFGSEKKADPCRSGAEGAAAKAEADSQSDEEKNADADAYRVQEYSEIVYPEQHSAADENIGVSADGDEDEDVDCMSEKIDAAASTDDLSEESQTPAESCETGEPADPDEPAITPEPEFPAGTSDVAEYADD